MPDISKRVVQQTFLVCLASLCLIFVTGPAAAKAPPKEEDYYYRILTFPIPDGVVLEAGAFEVLPTGQVAVSSRRGEIYLIDNAFSDDADSIQFRRFAHGLHEVLGLAHHDGWLYVTQRCDVSRLKDVDGDGTADIFEVVNADWGISGDYHEYAFGSKFDAQGNLWVALCLTGSFNSNVEYRGWCVRVTRDGQMIPTCSGLRSPGGIGSNLKGDMFYTDNQGPWNGTCSLKHLIPKSFQGHPGGNRWYALAEESMGPQPPDPRNKSRIVTEAARIPEFVPSAILFPYKKMGQSASGIACDRSAGKFGPFAGQMFVGDQTFSTVMRVDLEKVNGHYQGACFPFRQGFASGSLALEMSANGHLFVGGTNRGWGSRGNKPFSVERLSWTGRRPFEILSMRATPDGFQLTFTKPVDRETAAAVDSYSLSTYTYIYQADYGSPEVDHTTPTISEIAVSEDGLTASLKIDGRQLGHVHELHADGVRSQDGLPLLHAEAYYTLNAIPAAP